MAASPLAQIDWNNLESANIATAVNLLELAYAERVNMAGLIGSISTAFSSADLNLYPWLTNSPQYGRDEWNLLWSNNTNFSLQILSNYLSQTKIDAGLGTATTPFQWYNYRQTEADLLSDHGITEYPDMTIVTPESVKKWYDIITSLKWLMVEHSSQSAPQSTNYIESLSEGIFDPVNTGFPTVGSIWYDGAGSATVKPFADFSTDWASLLSGPEVKQVIANRSIFRPSPLFCKFNFISATFVRDVINSKSYSRQDSTDYNNTGLGGVPLATKAFGSYNYSPVSALYDPLVTNNKIIEIDVTRNDLGGNVIERSLNVPTLPIPVYSGSAINFTLATTYSIYEDWDQEGGFIYYTP